nr:PmoA family protein [Zobellia russellii]
MIVALKCDFGPKPSPVKSTKTKVIIYSWQESDTSLALLHNSKILWKLNYNELKGKPYFAPLKTVEGQNLVWLHPEDHPWHYGLWFSWKYINGVNFWEEDRNTGLSEGRARVGKISKTLNEDFSAIVKFDISYAKTEGSPMLLEKRTLKISAPDKHGIYYIDWSGEWSGQKDTVTFDRTPPKKYGGPQYGGYGGLSYRAARDMHDHTFSTASDWKTKNKLVGHGMKDKWMDLSGNFAQSNGLSGLAIFNHPKNGNEEVPWYIYKDGEFAFFNASPLFHGPMTIYPGDSMRLQYRILIHGDKSSKLKISKHYKSYINLSK